MASHLGNGFGKHYLSNVDKRGQKGRKKAGSSRSGKKHCQDKCGSPNDRNASCSGDSEFKSEHHASPLPIHSSFSKLTVKEKVESRSENSKRYPECISRGSQKRQKKETTSDSELTSSRGTRSKGIKLRSDFRKENDTHLSYSPERSLCAEDSQRMDLAVQESNGFCVGNSTEFPSSEFTKDPNKMSSQGEEFPDEIVSKKSASSGDNWRTIEINLLDKGIEIFGRNRSVIQLLMVFLF